MNADVYQSELGLVGNGDGFDAATVISKVVHAQVSHCESAGFVSIQHYTRSRGSTRRVIGEKKPDVFQADNLNGSDQPAVTGIRDDVQAFRQDDSQSRYMSG